MIFKARPYSALPGPSTLALSSRLPFCQPSAFCAGPLPELLDHSGILLFPVWAERAPEAGEHTNERSILFKLLYIVLTKLGGHLPWKVEAFTLRLHGPVFWFDGVDEPQKPDNSLSLIAIMSAATQRNASFL